MTPSIDGKSGRAGEVSPYLQHLQPRGFHTSGPSQDSDVDDPHLASDGLPGKATFTQGSFLPSRDVAANAAGREGEGRTGISVTQLDSDIAMEHTPRGGNPHRLTGPIQFVLKLLDLWCLGTPEAVKLLGFDPDDRDHVVSVLAGHEEFRGRDVRDRIVHLIGIRMALRSLFRDLNTENDWLRESHPMLGDRTPLSLLLGGSMEDLLLTRKYVESAAGR